MPGVQGANMTRTTILDPRTGRSIEGEVCDLCHCLAPKCSRLVFSDQYACDACACEVEQYAVHDGDEPLPHQLGWNE